ncbi:hypothetical protein BW716_06385 [[Flexibacter] sp. ATCC 35208]|nr:hypothetical protein BW716_06385 [[Flexibacter] sp. ATCC 35208]
MGEGGWRSKRALLPSGLLNCNVHNPKVQIPIKLIKAINSNKCQLLQILVNISFLIITNNSKIWQMFDFYILPIIIIIGDFIRNKFI